MKKTVQHILCSNNPEKILRAALSYSDNYVNPRMPCLNITLSVLGTSCGHCKGLYKIGFWRSIVD